jgi:hypothetical protein
MMMQDMRFYFGVRRRFNYTFRYGTKADDWALVVGR